MKRIKATKTELWAMLFRAQNLVDDLRYRGHLTKFGREQVKECLSRKCEDCVNYRFTEKTIEDWLKTKRGFDSWSLNRMKKDKDKSRKVGRITCAKGYPMFAEVCSSWELAKRPNPIPARG